MNIAFLSGKGGTGKTFVSVNLAKTLGKCTYIDCDVEEPNGSLFFKAQEIRQEKVHMLVPQVDKTKCVSCRQCVDHCQFNALAFVNHYPMVFEEICHACGLCSLVCRENAIVEKEHEIGVCTYSKEENALIVEGQMHTGEVSSVPVIEHALKSTLENEQKENMCLIDCPPGSGCAVTATLKKADVCVMVIEASAFGLHNFKMVYELATLLNKRCYAIINKVTAPYLPLEDFLNVHQVPVLLRIPYNEEVAKLSSNGVMAVTKNEALKEQFEALAYTFKEGIDV